MRTLASMVEKKLVVVNLLSIVTLHGNKLFAVIEPVLSKSNSKNVRVVVHYGKLGAMQTECRL